MNTRHAYAGAAFVLGFALLAVVLVLLFFTATVDTGDVGVITNFGRVTGSVLDSGWHLVGPIDHVTDVSIRTITTQSDADCFSSDLQEVKITLAVQTRITKENASKIYQNYGPDYMTQAAPKILDALKAETAKYEAAEIIANRDKIRSETFKAAQARLQGFVEVGRLLHRERRFPPMITKGRSRPSRSPNSGPSRPSTSCSRPRSRRKRRSPPPRARRRRFKSAAMPWPRTRRSSSWS